VSSVRRALAIACLALGALAPPANAAVPAPRQISVDPFVTSAGQHETAVEPDSFAVGNTVVAVFQVGRMVTGGAAGIGWATSTDGGATWTSGVLPALTVYATPPGPYTRATDPAIAYDRVHGVWIASVLALIDGAGGQDSELVVSRSADGINWSPPIVTAPNLATFAHDKNWIVCDSGVASPFAGRCYTVWADVTFDSALAVSVSTDGGLTWSRRPLVVRELDGTGWQPVVQPNGTLVIPYLGLNAIESVRSTDGGASFEVRTIVAELSSSHPIGIRAGPLPSVEVDGDGRVFVAWPDCRFRAGCSGVDPEEPNDIVIASSPDGIRWTTPARVPTGSASATLDHLLPGLAVDTTTSGASARLALAYYTLSPAGCRGDACRIAAGFVSSRDAGSSWSAPVALTRPTPVTALAQSNRGRFVGDYISTSFVTGGVAVPVFSSASATFDGSFHQGVFATAVAPLAPAPTAVTAALGRVRLVPARPRAGGRVTVSAPLTIRGSSAVPARLGCTLRVAGRSLRPVVRRIAGGLASCTWRLPGDVARTRAFASLVATVSGTTARRSVSFRIRERAGPAPVG
jgi:hypothetical protein